MSANVKKIEIKCVGNSTRGLDELKEFQGDLKGLPEENYQKLKGDILTLGFCAPIFIWNNNILDGHQRTKTLKRMREEGFEIPPIPVVNVQAKDEKDAKKIVLSLTSQFGKMTNESLMEYMKREGFNIDDIQDFNFVELEMDNFESIFKANAAESEVWEDIGEIDDIDDVPNVDVQGEVNNLTEYLVLYFNDKSKFESVKNLLGLNSRKIEYNEFVEKFKGE